MNSHSTSFSISQLRALLVIPALIPLLIYACSSPGSVGTEIPFHVQSESLSVSPGGQPLPESLRFRHWSIGDGLSHDVVRCILQDRSGFMWFGTDDGLNRFDGYSFRVYRHDPAAPGSLNNNAVFALAEDVNGNLWIGTYGGGLERYDPDSDSFIHYRHDPSDPFSLSDDHIRSIHVDARGDIWIATHGGGINRYHPEDDIFEAIEPPNDVVGEGHAESGDEGWLIDKVFEDAGGALWFGSNDDGLYRYDPRTKTWRVFNHVPDDPTSLSGDILLVDIVEDSDNTIWVATFEGLNAYDPESDEFMRHIHTPDNPNSLGHNAVNALLIDQAENLWIGTANGLDRYDALSGTFIHYRQDPSSPVSLSSNNILSLYQDRSGGLWAGTMGGGINRIDLAGDRFTHIYQDPQNEGALSENIVEAIIEDREGNVWVGTFGGGLNVWDRDTGIWHHYRYDLTNPRSISDDRVSALLETRSGDLWIGTAFSGLNRFEPATETFTRFTPSPDNPAGISDSGIRVIMEDREGRLWIGTHGDGINVLDPQSGEVVHYRHDSRDTSSLGNNWILSLHEDRQGLIWIGTRDAGLDVFDHTTGIFSHFEHDPGNPESLRGTTVQAILEDAAGGLWVATERNGLNLLNPVTATFAHYGIQEGLPSNWVCGILEDEAGFMWINTRNGLVKFDPDRGVAITYDERDGVDIGSCIRGAAYGSPGGQMYFGGFSGFITFSPAHIPVNPHIPPVALTSITQSGDPIDTGVATTNIEQLILTRPESYFEFEFAALDFTQPERNQYAYMLEGFDPDWIELGNQRFGRYGNLPAGNYTLRMIASNNDGIWNEEGISLEIIVMPPFWERWWFICLGALAVAGLVYAGYRLRVGSLEARSRSLEAEVTERTQELSTLNAIATVVGQSLDLKTILTNALNEIIIVLGYDAGWILLLAERAGEPAAAGGKDAIDFEMAVRRDPETNGGELPAGLTFVTQLARRVVESGTPGVLSQGSPVDGVSEDLQGGEVSWAAVPLLSRGKIQGVLVAQVATAAISIDELALLASIGAQVGMATENARLYKRTQQAAVMEERQRLARELHDSVTQSLYGVMLYAEAASTKLAEGKPEIAGEHVTELQGTAQQALAEMRLLIYELRPLMLEEEGLAAALERRLQSVEGRAGLETILEVELEGPLEPHVEEALFRISQEALNNAIKHGQPNQISVHLIQNDSGIILEIVDDGAGFDPHRVEDGGIGISVMKERSAAVEGNLVIESATGEGTKVRVEVPI